MRHVEISGKRLRLREVTIADVDALHAVYGDPTATEHLPFDPRTREEVEESIIEAMKSSETEPRRLYVLAVTDLDGCEAFGVARLHIEADHPHSAEIGLGLRPDHWGRGIGTDLIRLILAFGFRDLRLHRIWGARSPANTAAQLAMLVAGMVEEGRIRHHVRARGAWRDSIVHSALEDEWEGHRDV
ncbi:GNAT family protein [Streptosporangium sp. NPDC002544]|jgi:[ribosomal protein S5]-alanine N-acetyltransferase|uniref:GNAT family N-acetyltransferase n=1 Tax=unclassified Streptosporangium TaxID=2632669 RepID=UPI0033185EF1